MTITVYYLAVDGANKRRKFKTIERARKFAAYWVGEHPTIGTFGGYAVSDDGVGRITVDGCRITDLFPDTIT